MTVSDQAKRIDRWIRGLSSTWTIVGHLDTSYWTLKRQDKQLFISLNAHWLCFTLPVKPPSYCVPNLHQYYLQLCQRFFLCKFSLSATGELYLQAELPLATLERGDFDQVIEGLCIYEARLAEESLQARSRSRAPKRKSALFPRDTLMFYFETIEHLNWMLRDDIGNGHWKAIYKGFDRPFDVYLSFDASWVYFQTVILLPAAANVESNNLQTTNFLYAYLLELNERIHWLKFGLDQDEQILMMLEIPCKRFTLEQFQLATKAIAAYANQLAYDIQIIANFRQENRISPFLLKHQYKPETRER